MERPRSVRSPNSSQVSDQTASPGPVWSRRCPGFGYDESIMPNRWQAERPSFYRDLGFERVAREGERTQGSNTMV
jgi:hypothetical protein